MVRFQFIFLTIPKVFQNLGLDNAKALAQLKIQIWKYVQYISGPKNAVVLLIDHNFPLLRINQYRRFK